MVLLLDPVMEFVFVLYCGVKYILAALKSLHVMFNFIQQLYTGTILLNGLDTIIHSNARSNVPIILFIEIHV